uniref:Uncharacterized protein n=1 Tax=Avena sativa TaxID=4498 RepID=A0ACD5XG47_AVESA
MATTADGAAAANHTGGRDHVVLFPFMAKGHTLPLLHFATTLSMHHRGLRVTVVTTPGNVAVVGSHVPSSVRLAVLPFPPLPTLPAGVESTDALPSLSLHPTFLRATALLREPFAELMSSFSSPPLVLISDFFLGFTGRVAADAGVRRVVFHGMSCFSIALGKSAMMGPLPSCAGRGESFHVPRMPAHLKFTATEVPAVALAKTTDHEEDDTSTMSAVDKEEYSDASSWGVLVNSFAKLDEEFVATLESFYQPDARAWLVGPLFLAAGGDIVEEQDPEGCLPWLDEQLEPVVYVSFGTQAHVVDEQLGELVRGLAQSGHPFLWAVRSGTWAPPVDVGPRGRLVRGWVPQRSVLVHRAVGGFVSHCGWNSVMESLAAGKPVLAWPVMAEQPVNARHVADIVGAGIRMDVGDGSVVVGRAEVEKKVRRLMDAGGEEGRRIRARAAWAQQAAMSAVGDGGTSRTALLKLLEVLQRSYDRDVVTHGSLIATRSGD